MRRCASKPYEGEKPYIFVSYCHKDRAQVYPIVERLARDGYLVWYDEGIDPGSEWPEIIARHLNSSAACIAFLSENALNSHNCRREINFALLKKKPFISVILEQVSMSLGMEMQLAATQAIFKYTLPSEEEFFQKLCSAQILDPCLGPPNPSIKVSKPEDHAEDADGLFGETDLKRGSFSDKWFVGNGPEEAGGGAAKEEEPPEKPEEPKRPEEPEKPEEASAPQPEEDAAEPDAEEAPGSVCPQLVRLKTGEVIPLPEGLFRLGRSASNSYTISGNSMVGRWHARISVKDGQCALFDNHSMNRTFLNRQPLEPGTEYPLKDGDSILIANEKFLFRLHRED